MTVKVFKRLTKKLTCHGCRSTLEYEMIAEDLEIAREDADYISEGTKAAGVRCPDCKHLTVVPAPQALIEEVWSRKTKPTG